MPDDGEPRSPAHPVGSPGAGEAIAGVLTRHALLERLAEIGHIAPGAPLSFLLVKLHGVGATAEVSGGPPPEDVLIAAAQALSRLARPTDSLGRLGDTSFGVVLQGSGAASAAAITARLESAFAEQLPATRVTVTAATGIGLNAGVLPIAAMDGFAEPA